MSSSTKEAKLVLLGSIKTRILSIMKELKPILMFRYLVEKPLKVMQSKFYKQFTHLEINKIVTRSKSSIEENMYSSILCLMYLFSIFSYPEFDLDKWLRAKIVCNIHQSLNSKDKFSMPCYCLYLIGT